MHAAPSVCEQHHHYAFTRFADSTNLICLQVESTIHPNARSLPIPWELFHGGGFEVSTTQGFVRA